MTRRLGPWEIALIVIDVVLIVVLIVLMVTTRGDAGAANEEGSTTPAAASDPGTGESGTSSSTQAVTPPADALALAEFSTPSGNIWCSIGESAASCQIEEIDYQPASIDGCDGNDLAGRIITVTSEGAEYPCPDADISGPAAGDRTVLEYGQTTAVGDFMCTSAESGVTCTNLSSGKSFTVTRNGPRLNN